MRNLDKIINVTSSIISNDISIINTVNNHLYAKINEIWDLFNSQNPRFVIHLCSNFYNALEASQKSRFEKELSKYSDFSTKYHTMQSLVASLTRKGKQTVDAQLKAIDQNLFEKTDGDIRALIVNIDARELLRIVSNDEIIRKNVTILDYEAIRNKPILEDAFEDNVRVYLKQRSKINKNIKETALSEEAYRFFYYNNGITLTCSHFEFPKKVRNPIIELENLQIVNGSQTIHALYEAFNENPENFEHIDILCRIYETNKDELTVNIAEYTNSQNPVKSRDIRSNDFAQKKLEKELLALGYYYERKKCNILGNKKLERLMLKKLGKHYLHSLIKCLVRQKMIKN